MSGVKIETKRLHHSFFDSCKFDNTKSSIFAEKVVYTILYSVLFKPFQFFIVWGDFVPPNPPGGTNGSPQPPPFSLLKKKYHSFLLKGGG
jgi:hypothetical protein